MMSRFRFSAIAAAFGGIIAACVSRFSAACVSRFSAPPLILERDVISGQTKGCIAALHVRYTRLLWAPRWAHDREAAKVHVFIAAPKKADEGGSYRYALGSYRLQKWGVRIVPKRKTMRRGTVA